MSAQIKYLIKCIKTGRYIVDVEWDGTTYSKEPGFFQYYSFDDKATAERMRVSGSKVVAFEQIEIVHNSHSPYKWHTTPKKKFTVRCPRCGLGTNNPRPTFQIAYTEFLQITTINPCRTLQYKEVNI